MFRSPYETSALKDYDLKKTQSEIARAYISQQDNAYIRQMRHPEKQEYLPVHEILPAAEAIPAFTQPMVTQIDNAPAVLVDVRPLVRADRHGEINVAALSDYKMIGYYGTLVNTWYHDGQRLFSNCGPFAGRIFVTWLSGLLTRNLNLDMLSQVQAKTVIGLYFECLFERFEEVRVLTEQDVRRFSIPVAKASYSTSTAVAEMMQGMSVMQDVNDLIAELHKCNPRFGILSKANLYAMVARSWFGANAPILCSVALEYPPAFYNMIYFALNYRGYNKTGIGSIVYNARTGVEASQFKKGIDALFDGAAFN